MNKISKIVFTVIFTIGLMLLIGIESNAACSISVRPSKSEVEPGESFSVTITVSGGAGPVNVSASNASLSTSSTGFLDNGSETITCTAGSSAGEIIKISASGTIGDYETEKDVPKSGSATVKIKKKEEPKQEEPAPKEEPKQEVPTSIPAKTETKTTTTKKEETKKETQKDEEEEEVVEEVFINSISLKAVKENGEEIDVILSPEYNKETFEYECTIPGDVKELKVEKDAGDYTNNIIVNVPEELKEGENEVTLALSVENQKIKNYKIKVIKEAKVEEKTETIEVVNTLSKAEGQENFGEKTITISVSRLVIFIIAIMAIEAIALLFIPKLIEKVAIKR